MIVGVQATAARMSQETVAAQDRRPVSPSGKDERPNRWLTTQRVGMGSFYSGWRIVTSLLNMRTRDLSTEKGAHSSVPSVSLTNWNTFAISALPVSPSTTAAKVIAITPGPTLGHANDVARARSGRNARVRLSDAWSSISTNRRGNARGS
jgi:hypothetical protein